MKIIFSILMCVPIIASAGEAQVNCLNFTGIWKGKCVDEKGQFSDSTYEIMMVDSHTSYPGPSCATIMFTGSSILPSDIYQITGKEEVTNYKSGSTSWERKSTTRFLDDKKMSVYTVSEYKNPDGSIENYERTLILNSNGKFMDAILISPNSKEKCNYKKTANSPWW